MAETDDVYKLLAKDPVAFAINAMATRPQKTMEIPWARPDMVATRSRIGESTRVLDEALKGRENFGYALADALSGITSDSTPGGWLAGAASGFGKGFNALKNLQIDRAKTINERNTKDLADILAYDTAMGKIYDYDQMPYGTASGKGTGAQQKPKNYDFTAPEMPTKPAEWGELEIQATGRVNPETGVRTGGGMLANLVAERTNPEGLDAMSANQTAYAKTFTTERIAEIAEAAGGSRGIDTMPEVTLKGGPELSSNNMNSRRYSEAVQNRAWDLADQIIKANPNATITREELANAFINDFNHSLRKDFRVVQPIQGKRATKQGQGYQPGQIVQAKDGKLWKFKGGDQSDKNNWEAFK